MLLLLYKLEVERCLNYEVNSGFTYSFCETRNKGVLKYRGKKVDPPAP
jgi:hypothetical protein